MSDNRRTYRAIKSALRQLYPGEPQGNLAGHLDTLAAITAAGNAALQENRRIQQLSFAPMESQSTRYGREWDVGDWVTAHYKGTEFSVRADAALITVSEEGEEIDAVMRSV